MRRCVVLVGVCVAVTGLTVAIANASSRTARRSMSVSQHAQALRLLTKNALPQLSLLNRSGTLARACFVSSGATCSLMPCKGFVVAQARPDWIPLTSECHARPPGGVDVTVNFPLLRRSASLIQAWTAAIRHLARSWHPPRRP